MIQISRRALLVGCAAPVLSGLAFAQAPFPSRPIRVLVGFGAGGALDTVMRLYAAKLTEILKVAVIVENKPGASELQAVMPLINAAPDGYTLWASSASGLARNPSVRTDIPYDPMKQLTFISHFADAEGTLAVKNGLPVNSVAELVRYARANPGKLNYGSGGVGAAGHLWTELIKMHTKTDMVHVPFKSDADVVRELAAGTIDLGMVLPSFTVPFSRDGRIKVIGVTGSQRMEALPQVATFDESGIAELQGLTNFLFYGIVGPAGMPAALVQQLNAAMNSVSRSPDVVERLRGMHFRPAAGSPAEAREIVEKEVRIWKDVGKTLKISNY